MWMIITVFYSVQLIVFYITVFLLNDSYELNVFKYFGKISSISSQTHVYLDWYNGVFPLLTYGELLISSKCINTFRRI